MHFAHGGVGALSAARRDLVVRFFASWCSGRAVAASCAYLGRVLYGLVTTIRDGCRYLFSESGSGCLLTPRLAHSIHEIAVAIRSPLKSQLSSHDWTSDRPSVPHTSIALSTLTLARTKKRSQRVPGSGVVVVVSVFIACTSHRLNQTEHAAAGKSTTHTGTVSAVQRPVEHCFCNKTR